MVDPPEAAGGPGEIGARVKAASARGRSGRFAERNIAAAQSAPLINDCLGRLPLMRSRVTRGSADLNEDREPRSSHRRIFLTRR